jgi:hypothetical protein
VDDDESAKMLMLLGELGAGGEESSAEEEEEDEEEDESVPVPKKTSKRANAAASSRDGGRDDHHRGNPRLVSGDRPESIDPNAASGPVGEWLKAEGEARMKMADHRRLIYRWTNAVYRLLGMKIPRGMGSLFDKGEKNKREKFDRFLSYYYGTETFEPGTYWYNNADTIQFFVELIRVATSDRYAPEPGTVQRLFRKKDPNRQASTWIMVQEELEKTQVTADELRALFQGNPRVENGFPRGRPLFVPIPKNPKGHHKYTRGEAGGGSVPASPNANDSLRGAARGGVSGASSGRRNARSEKRSVGAAAGSGRGSGAAARASAAIHQQQLQQHQHQHLQQHLHLQHQQHQHQHLHHQQHASALLGGLGQLGAQFGLTEAQLGERLGQLGGFMRAAQIHAAQHAYGAAHDARGFGALVPGVFPASESDAASSSSAREALRLAFVRAAVARHRGFVLGTGAATDFSGVAAAQIAAANAAPGACERITLAPPSPRYPRVDASLGGGGGGDVSGPAADASSSPRSKKRLGSKLERVSRAPGRRLDASDSPEHATPRPSPPPPPMRVVGDVFMGALGDVFGDGFGRRVGFEAAVRGSANGSRTAVEASETETDREDANARRDLDSREAARLGRDRLMRLGEETREALEPLLRVAAGDFRDARDDGESPFGDGGGGGGRATREPAVDRTALAAELDSVLVAAKAAESAWRRHARLVSDSNAHAFRVRDARAAAARARADLEGALLAKETVGSGSVTRDDRSDPFVPVGDEDVARVDALRVTLKHVEAEIALREVRVAEKDSAVAEAETSASSAVAVLAASARAHKPGYEEVRKRALRLRLAAEERCERQISRAANRAARGVASKRARFEKEANGLEGVITETEKTDARRSPENRLSERDVSSRAREARADLDAAEVALAVIKRSLEGCKTAIEWSKSEIAKISSGRDV